MSLERGRSDVRYAPQSMNTHLVADYEWGYYSTDDIYLGPTFDCNVCEAQLTKGGSINALEA